MEELLLAEKLADLSVNELESLLVKLHSSNEEAYEAFKEVILDEIL